MPFKQQFKRGEGSSKGTELGTVTRGDIGYLVIVYGDPLLDIWNTNVSAGAGIKAGPSLIL